MALPRKSGIVMAESGGYAPRSILTDPRVVAHEQQAEQARAELREAEAALKKEDVGFRDRVLKSHTDQTHARVHEDLMAELRRNVDAARSRLQILESADAPLTRAKREAANDVNKDAAVELPSRVERLRAALAAAVEAEASLIEFYAQTRAALADMPLGVHQVGVSPLDKRGILGALHRLCPDFTPLHSTMRHPPAG